MIMILALGHKVFFFQYNTIRDDNGAGWVQRMGSLPPPCMVLSYPSLLRPAWRGKFSCSFPAPWGLAKSRLPHKTLLFVNLPTTIAIVFNKPIALIKIYLKLKINLSHQIKLIFSKNWIILLKCLTR